MHPVYKNVHSTNISALAYADGIGFVEFHGGRRFGYSMPLKVFEAMGAAKSIGGYFAKEVKGKYPVAVTAQRCNLMSCDRDAVLQGKSSTTTFVVCEPCSKSTHLADIVFGPIPPKEPKK